MPHSNAVWLEHPCGANLMLIGTQHVSLSHGSQAGTAVERLQPSRVVLELDEVRLMLVFVFIGLCDCFDTPTRGLMLVMVPCSDAGYPPKLLSAWSHAVVLLSADFVRRLAFNRSTSVSDTSCTRIQQHLWVWQQILAQAAHSCRCCCLMHCCGPST